MPILTKLHAFSLLTPYKPFDLAEAQHLARTLEFLRATDAPFFRDTLAGHITASAILTDPAQSNLLLIWHEKLRRWLQPGGHCEQDDVSLSAAARRELPACFSSTRAPQQRQSRPRHPRSSLRPSTAHSPLVYTRFPHCRCRLEARVRDTSDSPSAAGASCSS